MHLQVCIDLHATKTNFSIDSNWKDIQHCIIISYMQRHCNMIIARTNSWIASTTLSAIVFEINFEFGRRSQRCYTFGGCQKFLHNFADNLHVPKQEFNDIFVKIFGTCSLYRATHAIDSFIISFFRDNQIQNF